MENEPEKSRFPVPEAQGQAEYRGTKKRMLSLTAAYVLERRGDLVKGFELSEDAVHCEEVPCV